MKNIPKEHISEPDRAQCMWGDKGWVPLFVRKDSSIPAGNLRLLDAGAIAIDESSLSNNDIVGWIQQEITLRGGFDGKTNSEATDPPQGTLPLF